jgi:hypothetical protein
MKVLTMKNRIILALYSIAALVERARRREGGKNDA